MLDESFSLPLFLLKVREGQPLSSFEIQSFIAGLNDWPEAQVGAFLAHAFHKPLNDANTLDLTLAMKNSGECLNWKGLDKPVVDKHSTGGVGDKITLVLMPLLAALDLAVPTLAGRGLGHTGGTTDKFESVPGFSCDLSALKIQNQVKKIGVAVGKQSQHLAPADQKLYALRDITATVASLPLIVASILSKKLAESLDALVIDLKWGSGAFMPTLPMARDLAKVLIETAKGAGTKTKALITSMNQPLGLVSGHLSEMQEAVLVLKNQITHPVLRETLNLTLNLAQEIYSLVYPDESILKVKTKVEEALTSGKAYEVFCALLKAQGANGDYFEKNKNLIENTQHKLVVKAKARGSVTGINTLALGQVLVLAKAGRQIASDIIDSHVTLEHPVKIGDTVPLDQTLCTLYYNSNIYETQMRALLEEAYLIEDKDCPKDVLIHEVLS